ncbi:MAG: M13 family metallopeptidase [Acidobacteriaceae bacterium]
MTFCKWIVIAVATLGSVAFAQEMPKPVAPETKQNQPVKTPTIKQAPGTPDNKPLPVAPITNEVAPKPVRSFDLSAMDRSADPCSDFYQFACGSWVTNNPIPADQTSWGRGSQLAEQNRWVLKGILEGAAAEKTGRDAVEQKIGDFYAACMDTSTANRKGFTPIKPDLDRIAAIKNKEDILPVIVDLHNRGVAVLFDFGSGQDAKDATQVIAQAFQGGLGLPDPDYYLKDDGNFPEFRQKYEATITKMMVLAGWQQADAEGAAKRILALETKLAQASMARVEMRDPNAIYHKMTVEQADALTPNLSFAKYIEGIQAPRVTSINVATPEFFKQASTLLASAPLEDWKSYLAWSVIRDQAPWLSDEFVNTRFDFYNHTLRGQAEIAPRWKRCVQATDQELGEALGQAYVKQAFGPKAKARMDDLVANLEASLGSDIEGLEWMTPETKKQAIVKLKAIANKIGYPSHWRDYSSVDVKPDDLIGNLSRTSSFEFHRELDKIGKPVDKTEWDMTPPTVNAYYDPSMNNVNFPAGILQPPFFDQEIDDAVNYGGVGVVIGHELTHGFDDEGRQYDAQGNLRDWWTKADADAFEKRAACIVNEYGNFVSTEAKGVPVHLNGKLTLGENTADNGGLRISFLAMQAAQKKAGKTDEQLSKDGFTPEQRFFIGFGQVWCSNAKPEELLMRAKVDPHSPGKFRTDGSVRNFPEFGKAFSCKAGAPMMPENPCRVW